MTPAGLNILLAVQPVDMRRSFDGLKVVVRDQLQRDPKAERAMFVFLNRDQSMAKILWRDASGWCLLAKRLDERIFELPAQIPTGTASIGVDARTLAALLDGTQKPGKETRRDIANAARKAAQKEQNKNKIGNPSLD